jgi:pimeloyl-ACP methyl ester carboxylesterase
MFVKIKQVSMAYSDAGEGVPLVCLHGYPLNRHIWDPQLMGLSDAVRVLAPDLRGHGESQVLPGPYSMDLLAEDINNFLDALEIREQIVLCGLSMGGYVAFAFFRWYPQRVKGLVLTATRAGADTLEGKAGRDQAIALALESGVPAVIEDMPSKLLSTESYKRNPKLVATVKAIMQSSSLEGILGDLKGMRERPDSTPTLPDIDVPTLIIHGANDPIIPLAESRAMQDTIPNSELEIIPGAGHLPNMEKPQAFNAALREYLNKLLWIEGT